jgi:hypothetical protein
VRTTNFTAEIRIFLCEACGAPLDAPLMGGQFACTYCRATNVVGGRDERPTLGMPAMPMPIDEGERLRRLQMQDGRPLVPPPSLMALIPHGAIEPWRVQEVFSVFQGTRKEVRATHSPDAAERLFFLTLIISNHLGSTHDDARLRAVLETALDTLELPRHRQVIRGMLSRNAVREGDLMAAERWLAPCDPRSDDLASDSSFRVSRALLDTARGDLRAVIGILGPTEQHVPIDDTMDSSAAVLRANALEKSGDLNGAVQVLQTRMAKAGPSGRAALEAFIRLTPTLRLCEQSFARATAAHTERAAGNAGRGSMIFGGIFLVAGIFMVVIGVGLAVVMGGSSFVAASVPGGVGSAAVPGLIGGMIGVLGGPGLAGVIFMVIGFFAFRSGRNAAELRRIGVLVYGNVTAVETTGVRINKIPVYAITVRVEREGMAPYAASFRVTGMPAGMAVGARVPLRVHPHKPAMVQLESD